MNLVDKILVEIRSTDEIKSSNYLNTIKYVVTPHLVLKGFGCYTIYFDGVEIAWISPDTGGLVIREALRLRQEQLKEAAAQRFLKGA